MTIPDPHHGGPSDPRKIAVAHGRDDEARAAVFDFLRALALQPLEWEALIAATRTAAPYSGQAVELGFAEARAVVVLFTPDDVVHLHPDLDEHDAPRVQARPNVLVEAGLALATHPTRTVLAVIGEVSLPSNLAGRNLLRLDGRQSSLNAFASRLHNAGCDVDRGGTDWLDPTRFTRLGALSRHASPDTRVEASEAPHENLHEQLLAASRRARVDLSPSQLDAVERFLKDRTESFDSFELAHSLAGAPVPTGILERLLRELVGLGVLPVSGNHRFSPLNTGS